MNALQEAEKALDDFIANNDSCVTCTFWTKKRIGGVCKGPELSMGYLSDDTSTCEQHVFKDNKLEKQLNVILEKFNNAWFIVEGFLYSDTPEGFF